MNEKDLRIGNLFQDKKTKEPLQVVSLTFDGQVSFYVINREKFPLPDGWSAEPIPLTEDWLVKFGFERSDLNTDKFNILVDGYINDKIDFRLTYILTGKWHINIIERNEGENPFDYSLDNMITSVHQLQNLFYCLTGEELAI